MAGKAGPARGRVSPGLHERSRSAAATQSASPFTKGNHRLARALPAEVDPRRLRPVEGRRDEGIALHPAVGIGEAPGESRHPIAQEEAVPLVEEGGQGTLGNGLPGIALLVPAGRGLHVGQAHLGPTEEIPRAAIEGAQGEEMISRVPSGPPRLGGKLSVPDAAALVEDGDASPRRDGQAPPAIDPSRLMDGARPLALGIDGVPGNRRHRRPNRAGARASPPRRGTAIARRADPPAGTSPEARPGRRGT